MELHTYKDIGKKFTNLKYACKKTISAFLVKYVHRKQTSLNIHSAKNWTHKVMETSLYCHFCVNEINLEQYQSLPVLPTVYKIKYIV